jgi:hypothetical protein
MIPDSTMSFHYFPQLPPELRWKIWQMVICTDKTPRIHYYSLYNDDEGGRQSFLEQMIRAHTPPKQNISWPRLSCGELRPIVPPRLQSQPLQYSWTTANRFLYLWDAGLLTACKESRMALLQRLNIETKLHSPKRGNIVTSRYQGQNVYLKVSRRDIVCFRFAPEDMITCVSLRWDILLPRLPFYCLPYSPDIDLAFEFQDSWDEGLGMTRDSMLKFLPEPSNRGLVLRAYWAWMKGEIPNWTRMWLIDRGGRLPENYQLSQLEDKRYCQDLTYTTKTSPCRPKKDHVFIDGKIKYVESYMWKGSTASYDYVSYISDVPILSFIWKVRWLCLPARGEVYRATVNLPLAESNFFRVLRQLPSSKESALESYQ